MSERKLVRDLALSLDEYAVVPPEATLLEALDALDAAQEKVPEGHYPHRVVLVRDGGGKILGKLGHFAFLRALVPGCRDAPRACSSPPARQRGASTRE